MPDLVYRIPYTVGNMEYLQNCVKESLRMYPPLIMLMRQGRCPIKCVFLSIFPGPNLDF
jgi:cytochrome P450